MTAQFDPQLTSHWNDPAVPRHVLQMLIWDKFGRILVMHRSNNVKSARNVWSIPSGTHEVGETIKTCIDRELHEEFHLTRFNEYDNTLVLLDQYENIAGDEAPPHYHWIMSIYGVMVEDVTIAVNKEPDRHDQMIFVPINEFDAEFFTQHQFHKSLHSLISTKIHAWFQKAYTTSRTIAHY